MWTFHAVGILQYEATNNQMLKWICAGDNLMLMQENHRGTKYRGIFTPRCSAVRPRLLAMLTLASLSSSSDTESTWPPATASIRGVLQATIRGHVREQNEGEKNEQKKRHEEEHSLSLRVSSIYEVWVVWFIQQEAHTRRVTVHH